MYKVEIPWDMCSNPANMGLLITCFCNALQNM